MTIPDYFNQNPVFAWISIGLVFLIFFLLPLVVVLRKGRIQLFKWILLDTKNNGLPDSARDQKAAISRLTKNKIPVTSIVDDQKVNEIVTLVPKQSIIALYYRETIERQMFQIALNLRGPAMGWGYPGWRYYNTLTYERLIEELPARLDVSHTPDIKETIKDFFYATTPPIHLEVLPESEFQRIFITGMYILEQLQRISDFVSSETKRGIHPNIYSLDDISNDNLRKLKKK